MMIMMMIMDFESFGRFSLQLATMTKLSRAHSQPSAFSRRRNFLHSY
jgi:hypothetical protein